MVNLYKTIFSKGDIPDSSFMWWDWFEGIPRSRVQKPLTSDGRRLMTAMLGSLEEILKLDSPHSQKGALHGLGHLNQPRGKKTIGTFLKNNPRIDERTENYAIKRKTGMLI